MAMTAEERAAKSRAYYLANREHIKARALERYHANKDVRREQQRAYYEANRVRERARQAEYRKTLDRSKYAESERAGHLRRKYGITLEDYERMLAEQDGRCAGCASTDPRSRGNVFHVDHDHATGKVRGLLCKPCNTALGSVSDSVETLLGLASYLTSAAALQP